MRSFGALIVLSLAASSNASASWSYDGETGPSYWGTLDSSYSTCDSGIAQSPINFPVSSSGNLGLTSASRPISKYVTSTKAEYSLSQSHHAPKWACTTAKTCGSIEFEGSTYYLISAHFHVPGEHQFDNRPYPMGLHMIHNTVPADGGSGSGNYLVIEVNFDAVDRALSDEPHSPAQELNDMWDYMDAEDGEASFDLGKFIVDDSGWYTYVGSLTTPPCTEGIRFFIQATPIRIVQKQMQRFLKYIDGYPGNARPLQALHDREVDYVVDRAPNPCHVESKYKPHHKVIDLMPGGEEGGMIYCSAFFQEVMRKTPNKAYTEWSDVICNTRVHKSGRQTVGDLLTHFSDHGCCDGGWNACYDHIEKNTMLRSRKI